MQLDHALHEQEILRPRPGHRILQQQRVAHGAVGAAPHHLHERLLHVAGEMFEDALLEREAVLGLVGEGDGADLPVRAGRQDRADGELVGAGGAAAAFGRAVQFCHVGVHVLGQHGRGVFWSGPCQDHHEHAFCFHRGVAADVRFEAAVRGLLVGLFDGGHVGVRAPDQDVVQESFVRACAREGAEEAEDVLLQRAAEDGEECGFVVA